MTKIKVAVHKFSSCDGCQLAFINMGEDLLTLAELVDIRHFAEAGMLDENAQVDIAFVEGSISTPTELARIKTIRENSRYLISIGACATSGGIQALRNLHTTNTWVEAIYAQPSYIETLDKVSAISEHVRVDFELWGCPVSSEQIIATLRGLLLGVTPKHSSEKVCMECKRAGNICTLVTQQIACLGPVTHAGCGAICPRMGRDCYACYGPANDANTAALSNRFAGFGLLPKQIAARFALFNNNHPLFKNIAHAVEEKKS
ncbi:MAG: sulfhydrogenase subunit delta [Gammaproteobacteria bacterium]|nr:sulfhydrogenase subunit delta [Gammaproteobacteria bacterium]